MKKPYRRAYPDPIRGKKGGSLVLKTKKSEWPGWVWGENSAGKGGWIPETFITSKAGKAVFLKDYDAAELSVDESEILLVLDEYSGWLRCKTKSGRIGWIPEDCAEKL